MPPSRGVKKAKEDKSNCRVLANRYRVEKKLGSGNFGTAFLVLDLKPGKDEEEWKVLKEIACGDLAPDETVDAMHEAKLLSKLQHPNIVKFYDSFLDGEFFCIITEYCEGGDLDDAITATKKAGKQLEEGLVMDWFVQLVLAVQHMHSRRVLHRDLKARNIFLKNNMVKIGDFGISRVLMGTTDMASTFTGTPYYMSPEVLKHEGYNSKSDVWSIACILYELCALKHAFEGQSLMGVMYKIVEGKPPEIPGSYDKHIQQVLEKLLCRDPTKRPSAAEVTKIPFVEKHIERMYKRMTDLKCQKDSNARQEAEELASLVRDKTHLEDLQDVSTPKGRAPDGSKHLTPRERMRLRKMQQADQQARVLSLHARKNRFDNEVRKETLHESISAFTRPAWQVGAGEAQQLGATNNNNRAYSGPDPSQYQGVTEGGSDYFAAEGRSTVEEVDVHGEQLTAQVGSYDDRPITPMRHKVNLDDPNIAKATPPGLPTSKTLLENGASKDTTPSPKKDVEPLNGDRDEDQGNDGSEEEILELPDGIPEDADMAETFYSMHEDFESDSEPDDDYGALMDCMQNALTKTSSDQNATINDTVQGFFSPSVRDVKIRNLKAECEKKMGKDSFEKAYKFLKEARFGDGTLGDETGDERHILQGLRQYVQNPSDGFLIDQLLFLEEQAKLMA